MTESVNARLRRTITDMTRFEIDLQKALRRALEKWQPTVLAAVQDPATALTAAGELDGLGGTVAAWEAIVHDDLLPEIERLMAAHILEEYERHGILDELPDPPDPDSGLIVGTVRDAIAGGIPAGVAALVYAAPGVREFQAGYLASVSNRMVRTPDTLFDRLRVVLDASFREGEGARDRANRLESIIREGEWWEHRAITVARTEAVGAYNAAHLEVARLRAEEYGEEDMQKVWSCTLDGRTRDSHFAADGQRAPLDGTFRVGSSRLRFPGDPDGPAEEVINCVVGDTSLRWTGQAVLGATRRSHKGTFVNLLTAGGHDLTVTPNHPVLTVRGYVPAGALEEGDHVLAAPPGGLPQVENAPASAEEIFGAARKAGVEERISPGLVNFHGDVPNGEVDVVSAHRPLWDDRKTGGLRGVREDPLPRLGDAQPGLPGVGNLAETGGIDVGGGRIVDPRPVTEDDVRLRGEVLSLLGGEAGHADPVGFARAPGREAKLGKASVDSSPTYSEASRHAQNAVALGMKPFKLVKVDIFTGNHDVYNLHTSDNWFTGNGIALHNCRCAMMELLPGEDYPETDRHTERTETQSTVKNRDGSQEDEIRRREERGVTRALDDDDGIGSVQAAATTTEGTTSMTTTEWGGVLAPLGKPTGDGRQFAPDADVATRELPLPLMWQKQTSDLPHSQAFTVGSIRTLEVRDGAIHATGILFDTEEGREAAEQIREGVTRPSVDLCDDVYRLVTEDGEEVTEEEWWDMIEDGGEATEPPTLIMEFTSFTVMAATLVAKPAFAEARLEIVEEPSSGDEPGPDAPEDADAPADEEDAEESVSASAATPEELALLASAAPAQKVYADTMFHDPQLREPTPLHMTEDGRIVGHLALWKDCHMGVGNACVTPPASRTGYALFHVSEVPTDSGPLAVGRLTVGGGHADPKLGVQPTIEHYDDAGAAFALVRAGEDAHGIWVSGIPAPHATDAQVQLGLSSPLSGDWRRHGGNLELVAALSVNTPGFPIPRGSRDDKGRDYALVAAGALPPATSAPLGKRGGASLQTVIDASVKASVTAALAAFREESTREAREAAVRRRVAAIEERQEEYTRRRMGNLRRAHAERLAARKGVN